METKERDKRGEDNNIRYLKEKAKDRPEGQSVGGAQ